MTAAAASSISDNWWGRNRGWIFALAVSLGVSLAIVAPFFWYGMASGHDFEFHVASWVDVAGQWKEGIVFPRWTEWANHGFGEPRFIFYPPLSWLLGAGLSFFVPWNYVPVAFIVLVQTFAGMAAFALARRLLPERAALFGAICFAANPNALLIIYMRSDYAELLASAFFPLVFLAALETGGIFREDGGESTWRGVALFSAAFAAVWLSNAPAGVMTGYSVVALLGWMAFRERSWRPIWYGGCGVVLGLGLTAFYLLPAAYEQRWVNIGQALSAGLLPAENFLYTATNDPEHTYFNWIASTTAILLMVFTAGAGLAGRWRVGATGGAAEDAGGGLDGARRGGSMGGAERRRYQGRGVVDEGAGETAWGALLLTAAIATALMLGPTGILWNVLPKLRFVQFPWRWMSILSVTFAYFMAAAVVKSRFRWAWIGLVGVALAGLATFFVHTTWWDSDDVATLRAGVAAGTGFEGVDEYDPVGDDHYNLPEKAPQVKILPAEDGSEAAGATVLVEQWTAVDRRLRVTALGPVRLALRLLKYPAWRVRVNGTVVEPESAADSGQMVLKLAAGESQIELLLVRTWDRTLGGVVSVVSGMAWLALISSVFAGDGRKRVVGPVRKT
jgi:hypothetical protein